MKNCLVTGSSRGVGRAVAVRMAREGYRVYVHGRDQRGLDETCRLAGAEGGKTVPILADLSSPDGIEAIAAAIQDNSVNLLVNNAGVAYVKPFADITEPEWNNTLSVNVTAPFRLIQRLLPRMSSGSSIVSILSIAARTGFPNWSSYCMSKFAMEGFLQSLREELRPQGIRVINVYPGATDTDMWSGIQGDWSREKMLSADRIAEAVSYAVNQPADVLVEDITLGNISGPL